MRGPGARERDVERQPGRIHHEERRLGQNFAQAQVARRCRRRFRTLAAAWRSRQWPVAPTRPPCIRWRTRTRPSIFHKHQRADDGENVQRGLIESRGRESAIGVEQRRIDGRHAREQCGKREDAQDLHRVPKIWLRQARRKRAHQPRRRDQQQQRNRRKHASEARVAACEIAPAVPRPRAPSAWERTRTPCC